jgi:hypothetical protein
MSTVLIQSVCIKVEYEKISGDDCGRNIPHQSCKMIRWLVLSASYTGARVYVCVGTLCD